MNEPAPVEVDDIAREVHAALLELPGDLSEDEWNLSTPCPGWSVKDIASHLLAVDLQQLSGLRDKYRPGTNRVEGWSDLVALVNEMNDRWVNSTRHLSPRVLLEMLEWSGPRVWSFLSSQDPLEATEVVAWAGPAPAPNWLQAAREYTERWHHQQQIRKATNRPGLVEPIFISPILATFARALPQAYRDVEVSEGSHILVKFTGEADSEWSVVRAGDRWKLFIDVQSSPTAVVTITSTDAVALFTKGDDRLAIRQRAQVEGDLALASVFFNAIAIIA